MAVDTSRITRYRSQSLRLLDSALEQMRAGRWERAEDLMWGSLSLAVKGVALSRGQDLEGDEAVQAYATQVGQERRDRRIREAFPQLSKFGETVTRVRDSRARVDHLFRILEDVMAAVEHLWDTVLQHDAS
ncbi:MAG: hypothetical protein J4N78_03635 [Chloroflexi bacterium]|nr:hypothetical protein [Chloroflexota bacterium]MCI0857739.1 hypothetical protein [Chloroflexota bacterium]MCI0877954.1 hypothetical protein [Chloroflexota bacterium]